jgi:hypothetical protein
MTISAMLSAAKHPSSAQFHKAGLIPSYVSGWILRDALASPSLLRMAMAARTLPKASRFAARESEDKSRWFKVHHLYAGGGLEGQCNRPSQACLFCMQGLGQRPRKRKDAITPLRFDRGISLNEPPAKASIPEKTGCSPLFTLLLQFSNTILSLAATRTYIMSSLIAKRLFFALTKAKQERLRLSQLRGGALAPTKQSLTMKFYKVGPL